MRRVMTADVGVHRSEASLLRAAAELLRRARDEWQGIGAPYETAQARLLLGLAFRRAGECHSRTRLRHHLHGSE